VRPVPLDLASWGPAELVTAEATVRDERGVTLLDGGVHDLDVSPSDGGGPLASADADRQARVFGLLNVAFHAQRALRTAAELLGHPLPHLVIRIGMHEEPHRWRGGHYRVCARSFDPPEPGPVRETGEVHLGGGSGFVTGRDTAPYFAAPSHNLAIIYHEIGHHVCRHTADFRLNSLRPPHAQTNKKVAVDEGTCDVFTAIMLGHPDIYGWHRGSIPEWDPRRRALDPRWTMARFEGGSSDPHVDGSIWASACWSAREEVAAAGHDRSRFDRMLLRGLEVSGRMYAPARGGAQEPDREALKRRRYLAGLLEALLMADPGLADPVLTGMARHGIRLRASNVELREETRAAGGLRLSAGG
jgi:hypothetical protein